MESENDPPDRPLVDQSRWRLLRVRHIGCSKKVNPTITDHDCCGRCRQGRDCLTDAQRNYDGTGWLVNALPRGRPAIALGGDGSTGA